MPPGVDRLNVASLTEHNDAPPLSRGYRPRSDGLQTQPRPVGPGGESSQRRNVKFIDWGI